VKGACNWGVAFERRACRPLRLRADGTKATPSITTRLLTDEQNSPTVLGVKDGVGIGARLSDAAGAHHRRLAAGINPDIIARLFGQSLSEHFGQQFVVGESAANDVVDGARSPGSELR
jgi:hypothetical protein